MEVKEPVQQTPKVFSLEIENIVKEKKITHMDAVLLYCYKNGIEPDKVSSLITKALK
jgi:transposase-like protein